MQRVLVIDQKKQPLMPCHASRARELLKAGKATVFRRFPFTILLKERIGGEAQPLALKIDPGSKTSGLALVADFKGGKKVIWGAELTHRGQNIRDALLSRYKVRHSRRQRKTRYRTARFSNRTRVNGWLPPSLQSRIENVWTWVLRISKLSPLSSLSQELVRFDTQLMQNAEIAGIEYQQGELQGYEVREYLLEKWGRKCAYCGKSRVQLEIEHIIPKSRGGSNRVSNLTLACHICNQLKGTQTAAEFGYIHVHTYAKTSLKDVSAVNVTRWALYRRLSLTGLPIEFGTGGRTKFNRFSQNYPKTHWLDAACVGKSSEIISFHAALQPLLIKATGHGSRQMCRTDQFGFPVRYRLRQKRHFGFQTGDIVLACVPSGKYTGTHIGRIACRATGRFDILQATGKATVNHRYCQPLHYSDGYEYQTGVPASSVA
jgi:5-methylcytosine-specific restriction endonuclease McrA